MLSTEVASRESHGGENPANSSITPRITVIQPEVWRSPKTKWFSPTQKFASAIAPIP